MGLSELVANFLLALAGGLVALVAVKLIDHFRGLSEARRELWSRRLDVYSEISDRVQEFIIAGFTSAYTGGEEKRAAMAGQ